MRIVAFALVGIVAMAGCRRGDQYAATDTAGRDIQLPNADTTLQFGDRPVAPAPAPAPVTPTPRPTPPRPVPPAAAPAPAPAAPAPRAAPRLAAGTTIEARATREITSKVNKAGEMFTARISEAVTGADGRVVILRLTDEGRRVIERVYEAWTSTLDDLTAEWDEPDRDPFRALLSRLDSSLTANFTPPR